MHIEIETFYLQLIRTTTFKKPWQDEFRCQVSVHKVVWRTNLLLGDSLIQQETAGKRWNSLMPKSVQNGHSNFYNKECFFTDKIFSSQDYISLKYHTFIYLKNKQKCLKNCSVISGF